MISDALERLALGKSLGKRLSSKLDKYILNLSRTKKITDRTITTYFDIKNKTRIAKFLQILNEKLNQNIKADITKKDLKKEKVYQGDIIFKLERQATSNATYTYEKAISVITNTFKVVLTHQNVFIEKEDPIVVSFLDIVRENLNKYDNNFIDTTIGQLYSILISVKFTSISEVNVSQPQSHGQVVVANVKKLFVPNHFLDFQINKEANSLNEIFKERAFKHPYVNELMQTYGLYESCLFLLIIDTFKTGFENFKKKCRCKDFKFTAEWLYYELFGKEWDYGNVAMSFNMAMPFFEKYRLGIYCIDANYNEFLSYFPDNINKNIKPRVMKAIYDDKHVFAVPDYVQVEHMKQRANKDIKVSLSKNFTITTDNKPKEFKFCASIDDVKTCIIDYAECGNIDIVFNGNMEDLLKELINGKYINKPSISCNKDGGYNLQSIILNNINDICQRVLITKAFGDYLTEEKEMTGAYYNKFEELKAFHKSLYVNKTNLSYYNETQIKVYNDYMPSIVRANTQFIDGKVNSFDINKFYFYNLWQMPFIPVSTPFSEFEKYEGGEIIDHYLYLCHTDGVDILFNKSTFCSFGYNLKRINKNYEIKQVMEMDVKENVGRDYLHKIYESDLTNDDKKLIPNVICGIIGKKYNKQQECYLYNNKNDADEMAGRLGVLPYKMENELYIVMKCYRSEHMINGFLPLRMMLLDSCRAMLNEKINYLAGKGYEVVGVNTDALFVRDFTGGEHLLSCEFGGFKHECKFMPSREVLYDNAHYEFETGKSKIKIHSIKNEYDQQEIFSKVKNMTLFLGVGGSGKTHSSFNFIQDREKCLSVSLQNSTAAKNKKDYGVEAITFHNLLGIGKDDKNVKQFNIDGFKYIIIDEIFMLENKYLFKLYHFIKKNNEVFFMATGDPEQLSIGKEDMDKKKKYIMQMFNNIIELKQNKRCEFNSRAKVERIRYRLFEKNEQPLRVLAEELKHNIIKKSDGFKYGFSFYNESRKILNRKINHRENKGELMCDGFKYEVGMHLICKKSFKIGKSKMCNNNTYEVVEIGNKFVLKDILNGEEFNLLKSTIFKFFEMPYVRTVHSAQGDKVDCKYFLVDWKSPFITKEWVNVAITRCTNINNVYLLDATYKDYDGEEFFRNMCIGYYQQDLKAGRNIENFVDLDFAKDMYEKCKTCVYCGQYMTLEDGYNRFTLDRLNNNLCHSKNNVAGCCWDCNVSKK